MSIWFDGDFAIHRIGYLQTQLQMDWELQPKLHVTKKLFQTKLKKKQLWKSLSVIALSSFLMVAISLKEIHAHLFLQC